MRVLKMKWIMGIALLAGLFLTGCPSNKGATKTDANGDAKPPFKQHHCGVSKYDSYFARVYRLRYKLWKSDRQVATVPSTLRAVLDTPGDVKKADTGQLLKTIVVKYGSKLAFRNNAVRLVPGGNDPKAQKVATTLDKVYQTVYKMPKNLASASNESKQLVLEGNRLTKSVPRDFKGLNALKAPAVTAGLAESTKELSKVPGQVGSIGNTSLHVAKQFPAVFRSKK